MQVRLFQQGAHREVGKIAHDHFQPCFLVVARLDGKPRVATGCELAYTDCSWTRGTCLNLLPAASHGPRFCHHLFMPNCVDPHDDGEQQPTDTDAVSPNSCQVTYPAPPAADGLLSLRDMDPEALAQMLGGQNGTACYGLASKFNHSCEPNVNVNFPYQVCNCLLGCKPASAGV